MFSDTVRTEFITIINLQQRETWQSDSEAREGDSRARDESCLVSDIVRSDKDLRREVFRSSRTSDGIGPEHAVYRTHYIYHEEHPGLQDGRAVGIPRYDQYRRHDAGDRSIRQTFGHDSALDMH